MMDHIDFKQLKPSQFDLFYINWFGISLSEIIAYDGLDWF